MAHVKPTLQFEGKVVGKVATLVISAKEEKSIGVPHLQRPEVQHTLSSVSYSAPLRPERRLTSIEKYPRST